MKAAFSQSLLRAFRHTASVMGVEIQLNGETVEAVLSDSSLFTIPEEGGIHQEGEFSVRLSRESFDQYGKTGDPRRNLLTIDGIKYRVIRSKSIPSNPVLELTVRQDL
jgi:hypothetical protein